MRRLSITFALSTALTLASPAAAQTSACEFACSETIEADSTDSGAAPTQARVPDVLADERAGRRMVPPGVVLAVVGFFVNLATAFGSGLSHIDGGWVSGADLGVYFGTAFIPIAGPFVSAGLVTERMPVSFVAHLAAGTVELAGWTLCIVGAVMQAQARGQMPRAGFFALDWSVVPWLGAEGAGASFGFTLF